MSLIVGFAGFDASGKTIPEQSCPRANPQRLQTSPTAQRPGRRNVLCMKQAQGGSNVEN
jgi:hypothetical protein